MLSPNTKYPLSSISKEVIFLKNFITNPNIEVGDYTYYHDVHNPANFEKNNVVFGRLSKLIIGKFCQIAQDTKFIMSDSNHPMGGFSTFPFFLFAKEWATYKPDLNKKGNTIVGNDVWFGHNSVIMPGVKIGDGAIIGAYAVVTKDVPPYTIVVGNIRKRFPDEIIRKLLEIQWWNWNHEKITRSIQAIVGADIKQLLNE
jgi:virginiamycin A acetyltransferase